MGFLTSSSSLLVLLVVLGLTCADNLRLCVTSDKEMEKCETFTDIACILSDNGIGCVDKINNDEADITTLDGGDIYIAGKCHDMKPILAESSGNVAAGVGYYAVAVARKSADININTLEGTKSCHTGVNKTSGWVIPMSILFVSKNNQLQQASDFFEESCVPGATPGSNLCKLCKPNCERNSNNDYYGYDGAARCLQETDADVAFVKHVTFQSVANKNDFKLLCKDGSTANIDDYLKCNLASVPSHAVVAKIGTNGQKIEDIFNKLKKTPENILYSNQFGKNKIFSSSTSSLVPTDTTYQNYLGEGYLNALPQHVC